MTNIVMATLLAVGLTPALASAQDDSRLWTDLAQSRALDPDGPLTLAPAAPRVMPSLEPDAGISIPELSMKGMGLQVYQEEFAPNLRWTLALFARLDVPGDTSVIDTGVAYSDIFDIGYGVSAEASLLSWLAPHWAVGGYLSVGWDQMDGASNVNLGTGEFATFDNQDMVTVVVGGKIVERFGPYMFWEGYMGLGLVHYGSLTFSDVTTPVTTSGLQFFKPVTHGLFEIGGRVGFGSPQLTFDLGIDFRFMGAEARGRDVTDLVDPDWFFDFIFELGLTARF